MSDLPRPLQGIIPPMATPLEDRDTIDVDGLSRLVEHTLAGGVHGLFLLGTTGEGPSLAYHLRREVIERVTEQVDGRVPVLVGATDSSFIESINLAEDAADAGATAVVLSAPFYYPLGQADLLSYVQEIAPKLPLPLFLYNMPSHTKAHFEVDTIRRVMDIPNVVGIKDSSSRMIYFHHLIRLKEQRPDFSVLIGPEELLADAVLFGADGGVSGGANLAPRLYVDLYEAARDDDLSRVRILQKQVLALTSALYTIGHPGASVLRGIKTALASLGICSDTMAEPFGPFTPEERALLESRLKELALEPASRGAR